ncbi:MAG: GNAT family N-acetyltransferase [Pikeienuella sp.]
MITIRPASRFDNAAIVEIWHEGWHDAHAKLVPPEVHAHRTPETFRKWLETSDEAYFVAQENASVIGFVTTKGAELVKLYVSRSARGSAVATDLLRFAEQRILASGERKAYLSCTVGNSRAERFYRREGWSVSEVFYDPLWFPDGRTNPPAVETLRFAKQLC